MGSSGYPAGALGNSHGLPRSPTAEVVGARGGSRGSMWEPTASRVGVRETMGAHGSSHGRPP